MYSCTDESFSQQFLSPTVIHDFKLFAIIDDEQGYRAIYLQHSQHNRRPLNKDTLDVLRHLHYLRGLDIQLDSMQDEHVAESFYYPPRQTAQ